MIRTHYSKEISAKMDGKKVTVAGWVKHHRVLGSIQFLHLRDREGVVQITIPKGKVSASIFLVTKELSPESVVAVTGYVKKSKESLNGFEIIPKNIEILNKAEVPLPLDISGKIDSELETRLNARFMDLRNPKVKSIFFVRDAVLSGIREFCEKEGFIEIHTPKIVSAGAEGGATLFPVKYFGTEAFLSQSPQLFKQTMMATGFDKIYEIAPYFRAERSATTRHIAEFTQWDAEISFVDSMEDILQFLENGMLYTINHVKKKAKEHLEVLEVDLKTPKTPFPRVEYSVAVEILSERGKKVPHMKDLDTEAEKALGDYMIKKGYEMYFIVGYPADEKPFYIMEKDYLECKPFGKSGHAIHSSEFSYSFDLEYKGLELASGGRREHRLPELVRRMEKQGLKVKDFEFYLSSFKYGMPPHGGFGFGIDRMVQQLLNLPNIREAVLFPRDLKRLMP